MQLAHTDMEPTTAQLDQRTIPLFTIRALFSLWVALLPLFIWPAHALADEILVLRSAPLRPYDEAIAGFNRVISTLPQAPGVKTIAPFTISQLDLSGPEAVAVPADTITALHPELVVAVGGEAMAVVTEQKMPVITVLAAPSESQPSSSSRIHQVPIVVPPADQLAAIAHALPTIKRIGIIYDPQNSSTLLSSFRGAAEQGGISVTAGEVTDAKLVHKALVALQESIDALLLIPDPTVVTPLTMEMFALFSLEKRIPVIAFSPKYLKLGAVMSIYSPPFAMGEAAGRLAWQLLTGVRPDSTKSIKPTVEINHRVAQIIGLDLPLASN